ncbi:hypothetical protein [Celeribacter ethanolicus]|uniref:hypothetical protein n=1 Tax=Celeribacter ethanolicus TaxID=1758178 RepID=UPI00082F4EA4|nr:hypothetical protein [Celeribacter ethanolicus]
MDIDWLKASEEERMQLYKLTFNVGKLLNLTVYQIMDAALGRKIVMGKDYVANFRKGKIRRAYAKLIYEWLTEHHFDLLLQVAPEKFPETPEQRWQAILEERARSDCFRLVLVPKTMGIVERESQLKPADLTLRLGERFCFELDSEAEGHAVALQSVRGQWHNIPLGSEGETSAPVQVGKSHLPKIPNGQLDPLAENHDEGLHEFVLVTASEADIPADIKSLVTWVFEHPCDLHQVKVQFVK